MTQLELRACQVLLAAARRGADFDQTVRQLRREGITREAWEPLYESCGLKVFISGTGDEARRYVYPPANIIPFASRTVAKCEWRQLGYSA